MTLVDAGRTIARPLCWLARNFARALTAIGLSMHGRPYRDVDADPDPVKAPVPVPPAAEAARTGFRDDLASVERLTPDEVLWQAELDQRS
jgi:hypothetical protein